MSPIDMELLRSNPVLGKMLEQAETEAEARGEAKGFAKRVASALLIVLDEREIPLTDVHRERIHAMTDAEQLMGLVRAALHVGSADELFAWEQGTAPHHQQSSPFIAPHRASTGDARGADVT